MDLLFISIGLLLISALGSLLAGRRYPLAPWVSAGGVIAAACAAAVPVVGALFGAGPYEIVLPWSMPLGSLSFRLDAVSAIFLVAIYLVAVLAAVYGVGYLKPYAAKNNIGTIGALYNVLVASMVVVCVAANGLLFLIAWELMSLSSFFLVAFERDKAGSRSAAWTYLVATHIGTAFLLPMFILLPGSGGTLDFFASAAGLSPATANLCLILAVIGFGTKAGLIPFHVWLPEAHPAAPSHVSALMSGVMIKTGIYGLIRVLILLGHPPLWWGWLFVALGVTSGVLGVLFALAQHDIKRLLAYHSVENIGIIVMGIGVGLIGASYGNAFIACLGFAGALLHVVNHAVFKGLLFLGAGAIIHATHTREIDLLGGLIKKMPVTGITFLIGAVAICGLPPLNGFLSELLIYIASFAGMTSGAAGLVVPFLGVIAALALIGGLATACFTKAFGIPFLGTARSESVTNALECGLLMRIPLVALAALCVLIGASGPAILNALIAPVAAIIGYENVGGFSAISVTLGMVCLVFLILVVVVPVLFLIRKLVLTMRDVRQAETWGCGYPAPTPRMQYTASSFAQPITDLFKGILRTRREGGHITGFFPVQADLETHTPDVGHELVYRPLFVWVGKFLGRFRIVQHGGTQLYVLYVVLALIILMIWKLQ